MQKTPRVTVLMPVYNGEKYLREAIESILSQTFADFEFLIINDGSTDRTAEIIASYKDRRIRLIPNESNLGLIATLNRGLRLSRGEYIARMDADDISLPRRLEKQVQFMDRHPRVGVCGTRFRTIGDEKNIRGRMVKTDPDMIRCGLLFSSMLAHPTIMMRKDLIERHNLLYNPEFVHVEDFELWVRMLNYCDLANLKDTLACYRFHGRQVTRLFIEERQQAMARILASQLGNLDIQLSAEKLAFHQALSTGTFSAGPGILEKADHWLCEIRTANNTRKYYPEPAFSKMLIERWLLICYRAKKQGLVLPKLFFNARLLRETPFGRSYLFELLAVSALNVLKALSSHYLKDRKGNTVSAVVQTK